MGLGFCTSRVHVLFFSKAPPTLVAGREWRERQCPGYFLPDSERQRRRAAELLKEGIFLKFRLETEEQPKTSRFWEERDPSRQGLKVELSD